MQEQYVKMPLAILEDRRLSSTDKIVYQLLLAYSFQEKKFFPSAEFLATKSGFSKRHVTNSIVALENNQIIIVNRRIGAKNSYIFPVVKPVNNTSLVKDSSVANDTSLEPVNNTSPLIDLKDLNKEPENKTSPVQKDIEDYIATSDVADVRSMPLRGLASEDLGSNSDQNNKHQQVLEILKANCKTFGVWFSLLQAGGRYYFRHNGRMAKNHIEVGEIKRAIALLKNEGISAIEVPYSHIFNNETIIKEVI